MRNANHTETKPLIIRTKNTNRENISPQNGLLTHNKISLIAQSIKSISPMRADRKRAESTTHTIRHHRIHHERVISAEQVSVTIENSTPEETNLHSRRLRGLGKTPMGVLQFPCAQVFLPRPQGMLATDPTERLSKERLSGVEASTFHTFRTLNGLPEARYVMLQSSIRQGVGFNSLDLGWAAHSIRSYPGMSSSSIPRVSCTHLSTKYTETTAEAA